MSEQPRKFVWAFVDVNQCGPYKFEVVKVVEHCSAYSIEKPKYELVGDTAGGQLQFRKAVDQCYDTVNECFEAAKARVRAEIETLRDQLLDQELILKQLERDEKFWRQHDYTM